MKKYSVADLHYYRILRTHQGGVCGELTVAGSSFFAMENLAKDGYDSIPPGIYQIKMVKLGERSKGKKGPSFRFTEIMGRKGKGRPFLIHRAYKDNWRTLEGCIAPGLDAIHPKRNPLNTKMTGSIQAMDKIFELLGGFEIGRVCYISIDNAAPGQKDTWTKDQFIYRRKHGKPT